MFCLNIKLVVFIVFVLLKQSSGLECKLGATASTPFHTFEKWNQTTCQDGEDHCVRIEALFTIMSGIVNVNFTMGSCANSTFCANECTLLLQRALLQGAQNGNSLPFDISAVPDNTKVCDNICCNSNYCNKNSVLKLRQKVVESRTTALTTTTTTTTTASEISNFEGSTQDQLIKQLEINILKERLELAKQQRAWAEEKQNIQLSLMEMKRKFMTETHEAKMEKLRRP